MPGKSPLPMVAQEEDPAILGFRRLLVSATAEGYEPTSSLIARFQRAGRQVDVVDDDDAVLRHPAASRRGTLLVLNTPRMGWLKKAEHGLLASRHGEWYLNPIVGCGFGCTYCYLLAYPHGRLPLRLHVAASELIHSIDSCMAREGPDLLFSSGELADSLADAGLYPIGAILAEAFADRSDGRLELRTKSARVDELLPINHSGRTTVAFSVAPTEHVKKFEPGTASLADRMSAARKCQCAGYPVALKFEPLILTRNWKQCYADAIALIGRTIDLAEVDHVSVGCLRWSKELGLQQAFARQYAETITNGTQIEYRPGMFNGTLNRNDRLTAYQWMNNVLRDAGFDGQIWWSLEEPDVTMELTSRSHR